MSPALFKGCVRHSLVLLALPLILWGCEKKPAPVDPIRAVKLVAVESATPAGSWLLPGEVKARVESRLSFRVGGKLIHRSVDLGQSVRQGQPLARLDERDLSLAVQQAQALMDNAQTQHDLALAEFKRFDDLRKRQFISEAELDRRATSLKSAKFQLEQASAAYSLQINQRADAQLTANATGVITALEAEVGQVVAAGQPVIRLAHDGPREVVVFVPETLLSRLQPGGKAEVMVHATGQRALARIREVAAAAEAATRTFEVRLSLDSAAQPPLGSSVQVIFSDSTPETAQEWFVPSTAVVKKGENTVVWVLDESTMTVRSQAVKVVRLSGDRTILGQGIQSGQWVVGAGAHVLTEGQRVIRFEAKP